MAGPDVEVHGAAEAAADLGRFADQLGPAVAKAGQPFAQKVAAAVRSRVPRVSGALAASIYAGTDNDAAFVSEGEGLDYGGWIEFGGGHGRPYIDEGRYLYPTAADAGDEWAAFASQAADANIEKFKWHQEASS
jgi:phage gpG-like protein